MNNTEEKRVFSKIGLAYLSGAIAYCIIASVLAGVVYRVNPDLLSGDGSMILSYIVLLGIGYPVMYCIVKTIPIAEIPKKRLGVGMAIVAFMSSYVIMVALNIIGLLLNIQLGKLTGKGLQNPITGVVGNMSLPATIIIVVILAPIAEELVFRKMLVDRVYGYGELLAALTSGLMFGLFHGNFQQFCYAFGLGVFFSFIYIRTGRIIYTIIFHMCINFLGSVPMVLFFKGIDVERVQQYIFSGQIEEYSKYVAENMSAFALVGLYGMFMILFILVGIILAIIFHKRFKFEKHENDLAGKQAAASLMGNIGMVLFAVWWIASIAIAQFGTSLSAIIRGLFK